MDKPPRAAALRSIGAETGAAALTALARQCRITAARLRLAAADLDAARCTLSEDDDDQEAPARPALALVPQQRAAARMAHPSSGAVPWTS